MISREKIEIEGKNSTLNYVVDDKAGEKERIGRSHGTAEHGEKRLDGIIRKKLENVPSI